MTHKRKFHAEHPARVAYERALKLALENEEKHWKEIVALNKFSGEQGYGPAQHALSWWYFTGKYFRKNYRKAAELAESATAQNVKEAAVNLATAYELGRGVLRDKEKAFRLYKKAARLGLTDAEMEIARCYFYGIGVQKNYRRHDFWLKRAADYGDAEAIFYYATALRLAQDFGKTRKKPTRCSGRQRSRNSMKPSWKLRDAFTLGSAPEKIIDIVISGCKGLRITVLKGQWRYLKTLIDL